MLRGWSWQTGGSSSNAFSIIQTPAGTSPTATTPSSTLTLTSSNSSIVITGNSGTNTVDLVTAATPMTFQAISSNTNATSGVIYFCTSTGGSFNITLPAPTANAIIGVKDVAGGFESFPVTVVRNGSEKIENVSSSYICYASYSSWYFYSNGTDWFIT